MNPFKPNRPPAAALTARAEIPTPVVANGVATLRLYDVIDAWGGDWGVSAGEFNAAIDALPDGITEIRLLINSPGGEVWDGLAILNALRSHPARTVAVVEGIAASAASFVAAGCDEMVMSRNSEVYIHNAIGYASGDAEVMRAAAEDLERLDRNIASIYAEKSGKSIEYWLAEMPKDRFMTAEEALESGLADRIEGADAAPVARARFDMSMFARPRGDRSPQATLPELPSSTEPGDPNRKDDLVAYEDLTAGLRERLGVTETALTDEQLLAALDESLAERAEPDEAAAPAAEATPAAAPVADGSVVVEAGAFAELQRQAALGATAHATQQTQRREGIVQNAINEGRIAPASREHFLALLGKDEAGTVAALASFPKGTIPVAEIGHSESEAVTDNQRLAAKAGWGTTKKEA
ncbi:head maturation protease, ClpP-related [Microbacterium sp. 3J1]|uniref:head maturation protease, ClpP-related n=1 Tax=Microbacterium sp. 3J1 TaxID=861269 RepID=UPI000ADEA979|nr:head maturation protease, ClpP-related [Microbacterium sp. 3J1]